MIILQTKNLKKYYGSGDTQVRALDGVDLQVENGEFVAIVGTSGSGKSTLMKIIAGIDKNFDGEVVFSPGYTVGYLEQEPRLDDSKTVREVVEEGCATTVALLKEYEEINQKLCEPMDDDTMARLIERQGELYEKIDQCNGWELDSVLEGSTALAVSAGDHVAAAKILCEYAEKNKSFEIKAGFVEGKVINKAEVEELAKMPPKEVLVAKVLGGLNAPITGFVGVLHANLRGLVVALNAIAEQKNA